MKRLFLFSIFSFSIGILTAQEICDNGIDDDGDGLIDLNDPECNCSGVFTGVTSLIPNPSFEDTLCCPLTFSQMNCADGWIQASEATSDYLNFCGYGSSGSYDHQPPSFPLPGNGRGYAGFFTMGFYKEMIGACLTRPMKADTTYRFSLFLARASALAAPLVVSIYGTPDCNDLPWNGEDCPIGQGAWMLLGTDTIDFYDSAWYQTVIQFTPQTDIYALAIGGPCDPYIPGLHSNYYYIDELIVASASEFDLNLRVSETGLGCNNDRKLHAEIDTSGGSWQWYRSGVALPGETSDSLDVMLYGADHVYSIVYRLLNGDCMRLDYKADTTDPANWPRELLVLNNDTIVCKGAEIPVEAVATPGYYYQWSPGTGVSNPNALNPVITVQEDTSIFYVLTASYPGCPDTAMGFWVEVEVVEVALGNDTIVCWGDFVPLISAVDPYRPDYQYEWMPQTAGLQFSHTPHNYFLADSSAWVYLEVSTPRGCKATDSIYIEVQSRSFAEVIPDTGYCPPQSISLWAQGGSTYYWEPAYGLSDVAIANPIASPATPTVYSVYVTNDYGCRDTQQVFVDVYPLAVLNMPDTIRIYPGERYHLEPGTNCHYFNWFPTNGINSTAVATPVFYPEIRTRYFVTARTENGCVLQDSLDVLVEGTVIDMPNAFIPGRGAVPVFKPAKRGIAELVEFSVYNRWGNQVFSTTDIEEGWDGSYNGQPQPVGVYVYRIEAITESGRRFKKAGDVTLIR